MKKQLNLKDSIPESFIKGTISEFINWYDDSDGEERLLNILLTALGSEEMDIRDNFERSSNIFLYRKLIDLIRNIKKFLTQKFSPKSTITIFFEWYNSDTLQEELLDIFFTALGSKEMDDWSNLERSNAAHLCRRIISFIKEFEFILKKELIYFK